MVEKISNADRGLAVGIFAPGGTGKTTLAATITESEHAPRALYCNARGNPHVISSYADAIDVVTIEKFDQLERLRQDLLKMHSAGDLADTYQTIIHDNCSEYFYKLLRDMYGPVGDVDWTKHSATTADVLQFFRNWMDLVEAGPLLNMIFIFQEVPEARRIRGQDVTSRSEIAFNKALQSQVPSIINFLGRLYINEDTPPFRRVLDFRPVETLHQAKFQVDRKHMIAKDIQMVQHNPHIGHLLDSIRYNEPWPVAAHAPRA